MTESKPDQSASVHPGEEPDAAYRDHADEHAHDGADTGHDGVGSAEVGNGHQKDMATRLPPPWERVPADPGSPREEQADTWSDEDNRIYRAAPPARPAEPAPFEPYEAYDPTAPEVPPPPPGITDLGEAGTVGVDPRVGAGYPGPGMGGSGVNTPVPPGGFPMGWPRNRRPRQANLQLKRLDPWSVLKIALVLAVVLYLVWMVAVGVLYGALDGIGVWDRLNGQYSDLVAEHAGDKLISAARIFGFAAVVGAVNSLLVAVAFSVSAFIYNVSADLVGGIEVTLSERD